MTGRPKAVRRTEETILRHQQSPLGSAPPPARVAAFDRPGTMAGRPKALRRTEEMITRHQQSSFGNAPPPARVAACYSCLAWLLAGMTPGSGLALLARLLDRNHTKPARWTNCAVSSCQFQQAPVQPGKTNILVCWHDSWLTDSWPA